MSKKVLISGVCDDEMAVIDRAAGPNKRSKFIRKAAVDAAISVTEENDDCDGMDVGETDEIRHVSDMPW